MATEKTLQRRKLLEFMDRFNRWSKKLTDEDLGMVVVFCTNVQNAWRSGQKEPATAQEAVQLGLPGLGEPLNEEVHQDRPILRAEEI